MVRMVAVWGSPGSGKTTLCSALAAQLASLGRNVIIISSDSSVPALPVYIPGRQISGEQSLGSLLARPLSGTQSLKGYIHIHPNDDRIGVMGMTSGETPITHKAYGRDVIMSILRALGETPFNYVIFDCQSNPVYDAMTQLALATSEYDIRIITPDVRGIEFEKSQRGWLRNITEMRFDEHIRVIAPVTPLSALDEVLMLSGPCAYTLPYSGDVYCKSVAGQPVRACRDREGIQYDAQVAKLAGRMLDDEHSDN